MSAQSLVIRRALLAGVRKDMRLSDLEELLRDSGWRKKIEGTCDLPKITQEIVAHLGPTPRARAPQHSKRTPPHILWASLMGAMAPTAGERHVIVLGF